MDKAEEKEIEVQSDSNTSKKLVLQQFKLIFLYSLDLGILLDADNCAGIIAYNQMLTSSILKKELDKELTERESNNIPLGTFRYRGDEREAIKNTALDAQSKGGKFVFTHLFLNHHTPLLLKEESPTRLDEEDISSPGIESDGVFSVTSEANKRNISLRYLSCELRITKDGTLCLRFEFEKQDDTPIDTDEYIDLVSQLKKLTMKCHLQKINKVMNSLMELELFSQRKIGLKNPSAEEKRTATFKHIFLLFPGPTTDFLRKHKVGEEEQMGLADKYVLGILNQASWFKEYRPEYLTRVKEKDVGYREDEVFITDNDTTLIVHNHIFENRKSIPSYVKSLISISEIIISTGAFLYYLNHHVKDEILEGVLDEAPDTTLDKEAVKYILDLKKIVTMLSDSIDVYQMVNHGFSLVFLEQLAVEKRLGPMFINVQMKIGDLAERAKLRWDARIMARDHIINEDSLKVNKDSFVTANQSLLNGIFVALLTLIMLGIGVLTYYSNADVTKSLNQLKATLVRLDQHLPPLESKEVQDNADKSTSRGEPTKHVPNNVK